MNESILAFLKTGTFRFWMPGQVRPALGPALRPYRPLRISSAHCRSPCTLPQLGLQPMPMRRPGLRTSIAHLSHNHLPPPPSDPPSSPPSGQADSHKHARALLVRFHRTQLLQPPPRASQAALSLWRRGRLTCARTSCACRRRAGRACRDGGHQRQPCGRRRERGRRRRTARAGAAGGAGGAAGAGAAGGAGGGREGFAPVRAAAPAARGGADDGPRVPSLCGGALPRAAAGGAARQARLRGALRRLLLLPLPLLLLPTRRAHPRARAQTESGIADARDDLRPLHLRRYLYALSCALADGVDVRGYYHWTLTDKCAPSRGEGGRRGALPLAKPGLCAPPCPMLACATFLALLPSPG